MIVMTICWMFVISYLVIPPIHEELKKQQNIEQEKGD